jgi:predicted esterase YcpF (UPF0227 family)
VIRKFDAVNSLNLSQQEIEMARQDIEQKKKIEMERIQRLRLEREKDEILNRQQRMASV